MLYVLGGNFVQGNTMNDIVQLFYGTLPLGLEHCDTEYISIYNISVVLK